MTETQTGYAPLPYARQGISTLLPKPARDLLIAASQAINNRHIAIDTAIDRVKAAHPHLFKE